MKRFCNRLFLIMAAVMGPGTMVFAADGIPSEPVPRLSVRGEALLHVPADQLRLSIGVVTEGKTAEGTLEENSDRMKAVIQALKRVGLTDDDYQTGQFQVQPNWSPRPRQAPEDWRPRIVGYTVSNRLHIKTTRLKLVGKIIGAASEEGANRIEAIGFDLVDPRTYRTEAIGQATANAMADARSAAEAASVRLVRVLSLTLDEAVATPVRMKTEGFVMRTAMAMDHTEPPITSGDVTVRANVTLVYEID
ncbi:MAG: SIMPL domain-containing protein [bacterium]|nr:SIMPL domain-containing protein [bacterium]